MKKTFKSIFALTACLSLVTVSALAQPQISTQDNGFRQRRTLTMQEAVLGYGLAVENRNYVWSDNGAEYTYIDDNAIWATDARSGKSHEVISLADINSLSGLSLERIPRWSWSGGHLVLPSAAGYEVTVDVTGKKLLGKYRIPEGNDMVSLGDGCMLYTHGNNLYYIDAAGTEHAITAYEDPNIVCGQTVSRNEFGISGGIFPSPAKDKVAFYRKDESAVTSFPLLDITTRTGSLVEVKYPMNGMASEKVNLGVYEFSSGRTVWLAVTDFSEERYLTNITWAPDGKRIYIQVLDRAQKHMHLNAYDASTGEFVSTLLTEQNDKFVEPQYPLEFIDGDSDKFIYTTDNRDGYRNLYLCSVSEGSVKRLTPVDADVEFVAQHGRYVYYSSTEVSPIESHLFRVDMKTGRMQRLTRQEGYHTCMVSADGAYFIDSYSSLNVPRVILLSDTSARKSKELLRASDPSAELNYGEISIGTVKSADGRYDNYYRLIKPLDFDETKKYPVILYVYGGPHSQMVLNTFQAELRRWEMYMAQHGYVVFVMDNRGTSNRGAEYEKVTHNMLGKCEMADQMKGIEWLMSHPWVDKDRIGVHGWSYGGFMTISLMANYPDVFKVGVAGGPVIDWKWYEIMYGERYMETPETNVSGFEATSLIPMAKNLKGKLLICQGAIDQTVVWQHSLNFVEACIKNGVQLDYFPYPTHEHNVLGVDRVHLMQKVTDYFEEYLK